MQAVDCVFTKIINGTTQFVIPVFQRDYSWTEAQCKQLWEDVLRVARDDSQRGHFIGSVVYVSTGDSSAGFTRWLLIDGQQRLTTLTLMLIALRDHIRDTGWVGGENDPTVKRLDAYFLKNLEEDGNRQHKLVLRRHDQETLQAMIDLQEWPVPASERLRDNYEFFREQIAESDPAEIYRGIGRLVVVDVTLDRLIDDPQMIFESLNSTGMDLSQSDLIRNFILMGLPEAEQTRLYNEHWSKIESLFRGSEKIFDFFVRDYMALKTNASKQEKAGEIYRGFRRMFDDLKQELGGLEQVLVHMGRFARYHAAFSLGVGSPRNLVAPLERLRCLVDVPALLVMRLFDCHERVRSLSENDFKQALTLIESYVLRRAICGQQTHGYWQVFAGIAYKIRDEHPLEDLLVGLARQREIYRFPANEEFGRNLREVNLYGLRVCRFFLERLENDGSKEPTDTSSYSIEHIMPQNQRLPEPWRKMLGEGWKDTHQTWLHRLGNLTLTGYNSKYSDRPFDEKKTLSGGFSDSSVRLNKFVREQPQWTAEEMQRRGVELAKRALTVWPALVVDRALVAAADQREIVNATRRDVGKVKMSAEAKTLFEQLSPRVRELDEEIIELAETKSVSYHGPSFFMEVLPRMHHLSLLLPLDFSEIDNSSGIGHDATERKFLVNAKYEGGVVLRIGNVSDIELGLPVIRQAFATACLRDAPLDAAPLGVREQETAR